ncbi:hypothetical protein [Bradyrhizobium zhanjiangense]|uniref:Lipoprotein n=1 Tax=Bradyrhizobium zhanjiangense TaxID=1325107 RepID=A0ABY0DHB4_9BRAD|nr:hypothetical protein [Bradyrhizobium zhanjiangense]RXG91625.1 hypothetical protein EAS62_24405 [Bradyrhizobium zhanjiangense]
MRPNNFAKTITIPALCLLIAGCGGGSDLDTTAADAAQIGDTVKVRYPASTPMCAERNDASKVYVAGELAQRQAMRVEQSASKAVDAAKAARKAAMASAPSCQWAPDSGEYAVTGKEIVGDANAQFHTADFCLKPKGRDDQRCWWISASAKMNPQIERIASAAQAK